jgi:hypothetical protein
MLEVTINGVDLQVHYNIDRRTDMIYIDMVYVADITDRHIRYRSQCIRLLLSDEVLKQIEYEITESLRKPGVTLQEDEEV